MKKRLDLLLDVEAEFAALYRALEKLFPEVGAFWAELAAEEENHAVILRVGKAYADAGKLPSDLLPQDIQGLKETLEAVGEIKEKIELKTLTLKDALQAALHLETFLAERYLHVMMARESDADTLSKLRKLYSAEDEHANAIRKLIAEMGYE